MKSLRQDEINPRVHYAWVVAGVTSLVLLAAAGIRTVPQVLILPLEHEFGWTRADISFAVALSILWYGLGGPVGGGLMNHYGLRRVMTIGLLLIASGLFAMLRLSTLWELHLFWGLIVGVGTGMLANVLGAVVAQRWFVKQRGLILGIFGAASAAGQLILLPAMIGLNAAQGWRGAMAVATGIIGATVLPVIVLMRERPEDVRQHAYGERAATIEGRRAEDTRGIGLIEAIRTRDFWLLTGSFFICGYTTNGLIGTHLLPHTLEHGFAPELAGTAIALMGGLNVVGTLASGWLSDRVDSRRLLAIYYSFRAIAIALLPMAQDIRGLLVFAIIYGLDWAATVPPTIHLTAQRFGRASVGVLYGWIFFAHMVGAAIGAYLGGALRDVLGDYTVAFVSAAMLGLIAAGLSTRVKRVPVAAAAVPS